MSYRGRQFRFLLLLAGFAVLAASAWYLSTALWGQPAQVPLSPELAAQLRDQASVSPAPDGSLRFVFFGDPEKGEKPLYRLAELARQLHAQKSIAAFFLLGDNVHKEGNVQQIFDYCITEPFASLFAAGIPCYAVLGNHDDDVPALRDYELKHHILNMKGRSYYSVSFGDNLIEFFIIDTQTIKGDAAQVNWLKQSLASSHAAWKVILMHIPAYASKVAHAGSRSLASILDRAGVERNNVQLVLSGHNHVYERRAKRGNTVFITCGCSGDVQKVKFPKDKNRVVGYSAENAFFWIEAAPTKIEFKAINENGELIDSGEITLLVKTSPAPSR